MAPAVSQPRLRDVLDDRIRAAYEYAFPLFAMAKTRHMAVEAAQADCQRRDGVLWHERALSDPASRWITTPNHDTLYSNAWLDLARGPATLRVDPMPEGRYWSIAFLDAFTNDFAIVGQRLDGIGPVELTLIGPDAPAPEGSGRVIRAPGHDVWLFGRFLVEGADRVSMAHAMQDRVHLEPIAVRAGFPRHVPVNPCDPKNFLEVVNDALARNPPPLSESDLVRSWYDIGIRPGRCDVWSEITPDVLSAWSLGIESCYRNLHERAAASLIRVQGWLTSGPDTGRFGSNYALRAAVALTGLGALEPAEAMYFVRFLDEDGQKLDGSRRYRLKIPAAGVPTDSFWSLSMYEPTADGRRFFVRNPIGRYAIGDRTPGLIPNADGSLEIFIQSDEPDSSMGKANWLPAPAGPFRLMLRAYVPRPELLSQHAKMPQITVCGES